MFSLMTSIYVKKGNTTDFGPVNCFFADRQVTYDNGEIESEDDNKLVSLPNSVGLFGYAGKSVDYDLDLFLERSQNFIRSYEKDVSVGLFYSRLVTDRSFTEIEQTSVKSFLKLLTKEGYRFTQSHIENTVRYFQLPYSVFFDELKQELNQGYSLFIHCLNISISEVLDGNIDILIGFPGQTQDLQLFYVDSSGDSKEGDSLGIGTGFSNYHVKRRLFNPAKKSLFQTLHEGFNVFNKAMNGDDKSKGYNLSIQTPYGIWNFFETTRQFQDSAIDPMSILKSIPRTIRRDLKQSKFGEDY
jgi:hypothetical protein